MDDSIEKNDSRNDNKEDLEQPEIINTNIISDDEDVNFLFLYNLAKKMVLKRHEIGDILFINISTIQKYFNVLSCLKTVVDVYTFSSWLKALEQNKNKVIRSQYIELMILALQYPEPTCPFKDPPPETIDPLENEVCEMSRKFRRKEGTATCGVSEFENSYPSMNTAVSNDKCQYASSHVVPNVCVQCFYAFSDEPMYNWILPTQITVPKNGPHATDIEWNRTLAGIRLESHKPSIDHLESNSMRKNAVVKQDNAAKVSTTGSKDSTKKTDRIKLNEELDLCQLMYIEQVNRNVTEEFSWNDASLLTGEIILGAEPCSDRKVDVQIKTQVAIDEESVKIFDKLYPGDFKIYVEPSFVEDMMPVKKLIAMEAGDKNITNEPHYEEKCVKKQSTRDDYNSKLQNSGKMCTDNKNISNLKNHRQCAGGEIIKLHKDQNESVKKQKNSKNKTLKASSDSFRIQNDLNNYESIDNVKPKYSKCVDASVDEISGLKKQTSEYDFYIEQFNKRKTTFQRDSSTLQHRISTAEESVQRANARNKKSKKTSEINLDPSDIL